ncbi:metastasis-suppressor KiSS-1 [Tupaia chinensis]|uniref:metastasis-suppressor KiSS-1 n=1 Tax=Tupaia chinensis TaxID=246437 RepID=UPI0003C8DE8A|nr:metastasis-suppressor KiSS-1 [Tupaia chinensis]XP_006159259.1 metastasis-suppressor KiSS-1 [Tupaia chinensis]
MNSLVLWHLLLLFWATSLGKSSETEAPVADPRPTGQRLAPLALRAPWEQNLRCAAPRKHARSGPRPREASLCPLPESSAGPQRPGLCAAGSRLIPAPRGAMLVQREKDLSAYNWNSFGLRYGKRHAEPGRPEGAGAGRELLT